MVLYTRLGIRTFNNNFNNMHNNRNNKNKTKNKPIQFRTKEEYYDQPIFGYAGHKRIKTKKFEYSKLVKRLDTNNIPVLIFKHNIQIISIFYKFTKIIISSITYKLKITIILINT